MKTKATIRKNKAYGLVGSIALAGALLAGGAVNVVSADEATAPATEVVAEPSPLPSTDTPVVEAETPAAPTLTEKVPAENLVEEKPALDLNIKEKVPAENLVEEKPALDLGIKGETPKNAPTEDAKPELPVKDAVKQIVADAKKEAVDEYKAGQAKTATTATKTATKTTGAKTLPNTADAGTLGATLVGASSAIFGLAASVLKRKFN